MLSPSIFHGTRGNRNGAIIIVGESWGETEQKKQKPFVGETGIDLERLLFEAKIPINECFFTNVISEHPPGNDMKEFFYRNSESRKKQNLKGLHPRENVIEGIQILREQIRHVKPKLIIGLGNYSSWALTDSAFNIGNDSGYKVPTGIGQWRGSQLETSDEFERTPFLPTYHPAAAMRTPAWRYMIKHDFECRIPRALNNRWKEPPYDFRIQPSFKEAIEFLSHILSLLSLHPTNLVVDVEASIKRKLLSCIGFALSPSGAMCIPLLCSYREEGYWSKTEEYEIIQLIRYILSHPNALLIGHNLLFDIQFFVDQLFIKPRIYWDTMLAHHVLWPGGGDPNDPDSAKNISQGIQRKALYNCASLYCDHYYYWKDEGKDFDELGGRDELRGWSYNCRDCVKTFEVFEAEKDLINHFKLSEQLAFQIRVANDVALPMMLNGTCVNKEEKTRIKNKLNLALASFDKELLDLIPLEIRKLVEPKAWKKNKYTGKKEKTTWVTSTTQQKAIFYNLMGITPIMGRSKVKGDEIKRPTLNKEALLVLAQREPIIAPIIERLEARRSVNVFVSTFAESEEEPDGRMRTSYNPAGTDTFRFSSGKNIYKRGGNLQNIPSGKEKSLFKFPNMRSYFEPDVGYEIAEFDLSGADATIVAWEADDKELKEAFRSGKKIHLINARTLFPDETANMTDEEIKNGSGIPGSYYDSVKKGVHATNYIAAAETLAYKLRWPLIKAEKFQYRWFTAHPGILLWHERVERYLNGLQCWNCNSLTNGKSLCTMCGSATGRTVSNKFGFRIVYFDFMNSLLRKAVAWQCQSSVAINVNKGAIAIVESNLPVELLLQVHDSLVVQYPISHSTSILADLKPILHSVTVPYEDPLVIKWGCKVSRKSWGSCEAIEW